MNTSMHMSVLVHFMAIHMCTNEQGGTKEGLKNTKGRLILQY